jgi:hypothetical protein
MSTKPFRISHKEIKTSAKDWHFANQPLADWVLKIKKDSPTQNREVCWQYQHRSYAFFSGTRLLDEGTASSARHSCSLERCAGKEREAAWQK